MNTSSSGISERQTALDPRFPESRRLQAQAHRLIPGGCHTYAKGDDQYPLLAPGFIVRGKGSHVWDADGNEYIEYGMGCRAVALGHAFEPITEAVARELPYGTNFSRPAKLEVECAEAFLAVLPFAEMCKFTKNGSDATTAAIKLARAYNGREMIAVCQDQPFFSVHDWFIGSTEMIGGIPESIRSQTKTFRFNDPDSLEFLLQQYPDQIAAVILEPAKYADPEPGFLDRVRELCHRHDTLFILDEMITGFRWDVGGAQKVYDIEPDLSTFGKAMANGFSLSALAGKRKFMECGGLYHDRQRVFLLSSTHGAETHSLAAGIATIQYYQSHPVTEVLKQQGEKLKTRLNRLIAEKGLSDFVEIAGIRSNLIFVARNPDGQPCQAFRCLLMQELIRHGVIGPSLVTSYSHTDDDIAQTTQAFDHALDVYRSAIKDGVDRYLVGRPSQTVYENYNQPQFQITPHDLI